MADTNIGTTGQDADDFGFGQQSGYSVPGGPGLNASRPQPAESKADLHPVHWMVHDPDFLDLSTQEQGVALDHLGGNPPNTFASLPPEDIVTGVSRIRQEAADRGIHSMPSPYPYPTTAGSGLAPMENALSTYEAGDYFDDAGHRVQHSGSGWKQAGNGSNWQQGAVPAVYYPNRENQGSQQPQYAQVAQKVGDQGSTSGNSRNTPTPLFNISSYVPGEIDSVLNSRQFGRLPDDVKRKALTDFTGDNIFLAPKTPGVLLPWNDPPEEQRQFLHRQLGNDMYLHVSDDNMNKLLRLMYGPPPPEWAWPPEAPPIAKSYELVPQTGGKLLNQSLSTDYGSLVYHGGDVAWRNNNAGNIMFLGSFDKSYAKSQGAIGVDKHGFAIFPSLEAGRNAQNNLWYTHPYQTLPFDQAVRRWARGPNANPVEEEKRMQNYTAQLANAVGIKDVGISLNDIRTHDKNAYLAAHPELESNKKETQTPAVQLAEQYADQQMNLRILKMMHAQGRAERALPGSIEYKISEPTWYSVEHPRKEK